MISLPDLSENQRGLVMINFKKAIAIAEENLKSLQSNVHDIRVEAAITNDKNDMYEVSLSYRTAGNDDLNIKDDTKNTGLAFLIKMSAMNRIYKTFLIKKDDGEFKGFKEYKEV